MIMIAGVTSQTILRSKSSQIDRFVGAASPGENLAQMLRLGTVVIFAVALSGCSVPKNDADAQTTRPAAGGRSQTAAVDVAIATIAPLQSVREYTGTTQPLQEVAIRAQAEGQLQKLNVDVGDRVKQGQILAEIDDALLSATTAEAEAELASRRTEISQLQSQVSDARIQVEQARLELQQAQFDANRNDGLAKAGAVSTQQGQQSRTLANTAAQVLRSAQQKVRVQQQAIVVANGRIGAQQAVLAQQQARRAYAVLKSPLSGVVLTRSTEVGNVVQVGNELLRLGDFSQAKVNVQVSELDLAQVRSGGAAKVRLDAFPNQQFVGKVTRVSPAANPTSRLVPVEMTIPNPTGRIGSGLLARVSLTQPTVDRVVIPLSALQDNPPPASGANAKPTPSSANPNPTTPLARTKGRLFVVVRQGEQSQVTARSVALGQQLDGKVQILSGLAPGERYVSRAGRPLKDGEAVRLSILSTQ